MSHTSLDDARREGADGVEPRVGVILAAGKSERLRLITRGRSKLLLHLGGISLLDRAVRTLLAAGLERVVVVVGHEADAIAARAIVAAPGQVSVVRATDWERGNGASLAAAREAVRGEPSFVLLCGDHVFARGALGDLVRTSGPAVLVDPSPPRDVWEEATRVEVVDGNVVAFGKQLDEEAVDCGAFVLTSEVFDCQAEAARQGDFSLAGAVTRLGHLRPIRAEALPDAAWWQDVDTPHDLRLARRRLRRSLVLEGDGPVARYLNRPVSTRVTMALSSLRFPPELLAFVAFAIGMVAAFFLSWEHPLLGGVLVFAYALVDCVDGETNNLQLHTASRPPWLSALLSRTVDAAIVVGLWIWVVQHVFRSESILLLLTGIGIGWGIIATAGEGFTRFLGLPAWAERRVGLSLGTRDGRLFLVTSWAVLGHPLVALVAFFLAWGLSVAMRVVLVRRTYAVEASTA
jgi:choline kinase